MDTRDAADIIDGIVKSLTDNPNQFQYRIDVIGQSVVSNGGTGYIVNTMGGGPGSTTIGNQVTMSDASIKVSQMRASEYVSQEVSQLLLDLSRISAQLRSPTPDKSAIQRLFESLKKSWLPGVIVGVVSTAVSKSIGL